jgi:hypothetical protein
MQRDCVYCRTLFKDGEKLLAVIPTKFKEIPSRVHFALSMPSEVLELFHEDCYFEATGGGEVQDEDEQ